MLRAVEGLGGLSPRKLVTILCSTIFLFAVALSLLGGHLAAPLAAVKAGAAHLSPQTAPSPSLLPDAATPPPQSDEVASPPVAALPVPLGYASTCGKDIHAETRKVWLEADARYAHLMDDKFTIAILTYKRPDVLNITLTKILSAPIPSLHEIVIISVEPPNPPPSYTTPSGVRIRYRRSSHNSLNQRFIPDPLYETQAILSHDDDVMWEPSDLEFVFQTWRQLGRYRITGALPRCFSRNDKGSLSYHPCKKGNDWYSLVLTNLAFVHISFMDYYSSSEQIPTTIRAHVEENFNCEDLAMNYMASMLTCTGPLHVQGKAKVTNQDPKKGISRGGNHFAKRNRCLNYFEEVIGFFPLVQQMGSIHRGMDWFN
ncbi:glycosyl transferase family 64 domain-containing protein [Cercophora newfieldiana]|uniref:Glycosyl transferase family 64 domain-containing protein n=1 Tax=Cercophora newfieldiana TaxID=92897 RepID=A0AA39YC09_9PEZI|nr:glycosyl transferase family 64 domain-containing protein [Cercophora newfieldiana]